MYQALVKEDKMHSLIPITVFVVLSFVGVIAVFWFRIRAIKEEHRRWAFVKAANKEANKHQ